MNQMTRNRLNRLALVCLLVALAIILSSCTESTKPKTGKLVGNVELINDSGDGSMDPLDFSGVSISIYNTSSIDTTLSRLNTRYPTIGIIVDQKSEFDHRLANPIKSTTTLGDGSFELAGIEEGTYNLVIRKEGWGYKYVHNVQISEGTNTLADLIGKTNIILKPEIHISGYYTTQTVTADADHHIVVEENCFFLETSTLILKPGAVLRINPGKKIEIYSRIQAKGQADSLITITTNDRVNSTEAGEPADFDRIGLNQGAQIMFGAIEYLNMSHSDGGFNLNTHTTIKNSRLMGTNNMITQSGTQENLLTINLLNNIMSLDPSSPNYVMSLTGLSDGLIEKNIIYHSQNGIYCTNAVGLLFKSNYVSVSNNAMYLNQNVVIDITKNEIIATELGIKTYWGITSNITYNNIVSKDGIQYRSYSNMGTVHYNNIYCSHWGIDFVTNSPHLGNLPAQNNWWNTNSEEIIQQLINDKSDYPPTWQYYDTFMYVTYSPFRQSKQNNAGI